MHVSVKVKAAARRESLKKVSANRFELSVREPAQNNRANQRVAELIADYYGLPVKKVRIIKGHRAPSKLLVVDTV